MAKANSKQKTPNPATQVDQKLADWLKDQSRKLERLDTQGHILKINFVKNAKEKGEILLKVQERLKETSLTFKEWVVNSTDIGYSTARLWMDVAKNYDVVEMKFLDSNPLELSLRDIRETLKHARAAKGEGKPGSGKRKATDSDTQQSGDEDDDYDNDSDEPEGGVAITIESDAANRKRSERFVSEAEAEAEQLEKGPKVEPEVKNYKATVMVFSESDEATVAKAFSDWSPITTRMAGSKDCAVVTAHPQPTQIGSLLQKLGAALDETQPQKLKVSIVR